MLEEAQKKGLRVIFLDETSFNYSTLPKLAFMSKNKNINFPIRRINLGTITLTMAVSKEYGVESYLLHYGALDSSQFCELLYDLKSKHD